MCVCIYIYTHIHTHTYIQTNTWGHGVMAELENLCSLASVSARLDKLRKSWDRHMARRSVVEGYIHRCLDCPLVWPSIPPTIFFLTVSFPSHWMSNGVPLERPIDLMFIRVIFAPAHYVIWSWNRFLLEFKSTKKDIFCTLFKYTISWIMVRSKSVLPAACCGSTIFHNKKTNTKFISQHSF